MEVSRRTFMAAGVAAAAGASAMGERANVNTPKVCVFSKHLQFLDYDALAKAGKDLGLDGIDLTVRTGGHVEPAKIDVDLPRAVDAIRAQGLDVPMISTRLTKGSEPDVPVIFDAAAKAGIRFIRIDGQRYGDTGDPMAELPKFAEDLRGLAVQARDRGLTLGFHNHSGEKRVGSVLWDLHRMLTDVGIDNLGSNFDVGHATIVGGLKAWELHARLMAAHVKMMAVKDFVWNGDDERWVPLGQGIVQTTEFLRVFGGVGFAGPISLHFEYATPSHAALLEDMRAAVATLRDALRQAGYA